MIVMGTDMRASGVKRSVRRIVIPMFFLPAILCHGTANAGADDTVATVGRFIITKQDLLDSYEFGPAFVKRLPHPLRRHLNYMVNERLLALEAERLRLDTTVFVRDRVAALEEDLAVGELYREEILSRVHVSDAELDTALQKARMRVRLRWLFATDRSRAAALAELARRGRFDSLFLAQPDSLGDRSLETTVLGLELSVPEFALAIRTLRVKEISPPLEGPDGFYIVRIEQIWQNPLLTESDAARLRAETLSALKAARAEALASAFAEEKMRSAAPVIKAEGYNIVRAYLADRGLSHDRRLSWNIPSTFMTEAGPVPITSSEQFLHRPLVQFGSHVFTVSDYLRWFDIRQPQLKRYSLSAFNTSIRQTIWKMVRDKLLSEEAYARGLHQRHSLRHQATTWEAKILYLAARRHLMRSIVVTDSVLQEQYRKRYTREGNTNKSISSFEEVRDQLEAEEYLRQEQARLLDLLQELRRRHPPRLNEPLLRELSATIRADPGAIELKVYKPGGTFPRVAFPTIDERWQLLSH